MNNAGSRRSASLTLVGEESGFVCMDWPDSLAHAVSSIEVQEIGGGDAPLIVVKKVKFWDKGAALDRLFKHAGLYAKDNVQKVESIKAMLEEIAALGRGLPYKPVTIENGSDG